MILRVRFHPSLPRYLPIEELARAELCIVIVHYISKADNSTDDAFASVH
jgi:hypothetical protein